MYGFCLSRKTCNQLLVFKFCTCQYKPWIYFKNVSLGIIVHLQISLSGKGVSMQLKLCHVWRRKLTGLWTGLTHKELVVFKCIKISVGKMTKLYFRTLINFILCWKGVMTHILLVAISLDKNTEYVTGFLRSPMFFFVFSRHWKCLKFVQIHPWDLKKS